MAAGIDGSGSFRWRDYELTPPQKEACNNATKLALQILANRPLGQEPILLSRKEYPDLPRSVLYNPLSKKIFVLLTRCRTQGDPLVGRGAYKKIKFAVDAEGQKFIVATMRKEDILNCEQWERLANEKTSLEKLRGVAGVVQLEGAVNTSRKYYLVMEYCKEGDLFDYASRQTGRVLPSQRKIEVFRVLLQNLVNIHQKDILHHDLRLENIFVNSGPDKRWVLKIGDFGMSSSPVGGKETVLWGDQYQWAPEKIENLEKELPIEILKKSDVWSLAGALYSFFVGGCLPWTWRQLQANGPKGVSPDTIIYPTDVLRKIKDKQTTSFLEKELRKNSVPENLKRLILDLLNVDPNARPTAAEALRRMDGWSDQLLSESKRCS